MPNTRITRKPLSLTLTEQFGFTHAFIVDHTDLDLTTAATAQTLALLDVAKGDIVQACAVDVLTAFENTADAAFNDVQIEVGDSGSVARFLAAQQVNVNGTEVMAKAGTGTQYAYTSTTTVDIKVGSMTGKNLDALNKGKLVVYLRVVKLAPLTAEILGAANV